MDGVNKEYPKTHQLLERVCSGDDAALDELFGHHREYLRRLVQLRMDPRLYQRVDPSDVVQEAQMEAARRMPSYVQGRPMTFRLWLRQIAYDRLIMLQRRHIKAQRRAIIRDVQQGDKSSPRLTEQLQADDPTPSQHYVSNELNHRVRKAVSHLPDLDREIIILRNFEGFEQ